MHYKKQFAMSSESNKQNSSQTVFRANNDEPEIQHYGKKGQKWGQNIFTTTINGVRYSVNNLPLGASGKTSSLKSSISNALAKYHSTVISKVNGVSSASSSGSKKKGSLKLKSSSFKSATKSTTTSSNSSKSSKSSKKSSSKSSSSKSSSSKSSSGNNSASTNKAASLSSSNSSAASSSSSSSGRTGLTNALDRYSYDERTKELSNSLVQALKELSTIDETKNE